MTETEIAAAKARKFTADLRVRELRGLASGLREKAGSTTHVFWTMGKLLGEVADEHEQLAAENFMLKTKGGAS